MSVLEASTTTVHPYKSGWLTVIAGSMFCGKTESLMRLLRRHVIAGRRVLALKPEKDRRFGITAALGSHDRGTFDAKLVDRVGSIRPLVEEAHADVVGIDEAQFFNVTLSRVAEDLVDEGKRVIIAGLDQDYSGGAFEVTALLLAAADEVIKLTAVCVCCGRDATESFRREGGGRRIEVGAGDKYEARCRACWLEGLAEHVAAARARELADG